MRDAELEFSNAQAVTASAGSTNTVDIGSRREMFGAGEAVGVEVTVETTFAHAGSTLQVSLQSDDNTGFASATTVWSIAAVAVADLVAGYKFKCPPVPPELFEDEQYLRLYYTVAGGSFTAGKLDAALVPLAGSQTNGYAAIAGWQA